MIMIIDNGFSLLWEFSRNNKCGHTPLMRLRTYLAQIVKNFLNNEGIWMNVDNRGKHFLITNDTKNTEWFILNQGQINY